jgi:hypothetical protein
MGGDGFSNPGLVAILTENFPKPLSGQAVSSIIDKNPGGATVLD